MRERQRSIYKCWYFFQNFPGLVAVDAILEDRSEIDSNTEKGENQTEKKPEIQGTLKRML